MRTALTLRALLFFVLLPSFFIHRAEGQYSINWYKIAGGGGSSSTARYSLVGTIGQTEASGPMMGRSYALTGGFWSLVSAVQTPGAPLLYISHAGSTVTVYWQDIAGWFLQQGSSLTSSGGWSVSSGVSTSNGTNYLNITLPVGNLFFRLKGP
jgi:hypothetical protein